MLWTGKGAERQKGEGPGGCARGPKGGGWGGGGGLVHLQDPEGGKQRAGLSDTWEQPKPGLEPLGQGLPPSSHGERGG